MKRLTSLITLLFIFIVCSGFCIGNASYFISAKTDKYEYFTTNEVEHLFTHALIAFPEIAFTKNNPMRSAYMQDCITKNEFKKILESLYKNNYALIDIHETFKTENGITSRAEFRVPKGKKALILSFDDINYDSKKCGYGMVDKLKLNNKSEIVSVTNINNKEITSQTNEFVPILDNFVKEHPDFSIRGAKGTINLTGYDGILGYRVSCDDITTRNNEINQVLPIVKKLIATGWNFACHSFGHYHMKKISTSQFKEEIDNWNNYIKPLLPDTPVYVYPYGEWEVFDKNGLSEKHKLLVQNGFKLFCGVGMKTYYSHLPNNFKEKVLFMDRKVIDGGTLKNNNKYLLPFFSPSQIYDYSYRN